MSTTAVPDLVVVRVVDKRSGREISWQDTLVEKLKDRMEDVRTGVIAGATAAAVDLDALPRTSSWQASELSVCFGVTLTAESGVVLSKASVEATFEVTVTFSRV